MSTFPEVGAIPPSPEVEHEMALTVIRFFQTANDDYRQLATLVHRFPTSKRVATLRTVCEAVGDSSDPLIEADFFRNIHPGLVETSVNALIHEAVQNRELAASLDKDSYDSDELDDEFRESVIERILAHDTAADDESQEPGPLIVFDPLEQLSTGALIKFMGGIHEYSVHSILESLEESEAVSAGLEREYQKQERIRTAVVGLVAFAGALGGSFAANRLGKRS